MKEDEMTDKAPQIMKFRAITLETHQLLVDLLRDMPRKVTDPIYNQIMNAPTVDIDINKFNENR